MEELQKELTIKEIKYQIKELEKDLELYLTLKKINYQKTQPKAVTYKEIVTSGGSNNFDRFTHYVIKDEDYGKNKGQCKRAEILGQEVCKSAVLDWLWG